MKPSTLIPTLSLLALTSAHSWLHCTSFDNTDLLQWMKGNATITGHILDAVQPEWAHLCAGWPRAKQNPGDWVDETKNYLWDLALAASKYDNSPCHPSQRSPIYYTTAPSPSSPANPKIPYHDAPAPMTTARAGSHIQLLFGGNGHSRGSFGGVETGDAGRVGVYWGGEVEREIMSVNELTPSNLIQENGFSEESFAWPLDLTVTSPPALKDKGNWQTVHLPECMEPGRHMMVWVWSIAGKKSFSTCFDVLIQ